MPEIINDLIDVVRRKRYVRHVQLAAHLDLCHDRAQRTEPRHVAGLTLAGSEVRRLRKIVEDCLRLFPLGDAGLTMPHSAVFDVRIQRRLRGFARVILDVLIVQHKALFQLPLYLSHIEAEGRRPATIVHYGETLRRFEAWLLAAHGLTLTDQNIERVSGLLLSEYVQMLYANGLKISTRNNYIIVLKEFFEFMNGAGVIRGNPSSVLHCVKDNDKKEMEAEEVDQKAYTPEEISRLLLSIESRNPHMNDARDRAIIALFLGSAMRATEVCQLNLSHAEQIRKGSSCRRAETDRGHGQLPRRDGRSCASQNTGKVW